MEGEEEGGDAEEEDAVVALQPRRVAPELVLEGSDERLVGPLQEALTQPRQHLQALEGQGVVAGLIDAGAWGHTKRGERKGRVSAVGPTSRQREQRRGKSGRGGEGAIPATGPALPPPPTRKTALRRVRFRVAWGRASSRDEGPQGLATTLKDTTPDDTTSKNVNSQHTGQTHRLHKGLSPIPLGQDERKEVCEGVVRT